MITSWSVLLLLMADSISFPILGMSFLVSLWRQRRFQCGRRVTDRVIAALSHSCSRGMIEVSLERSQIVHWKQLWWLPYPVREEIYWMRWKFLQAFLLWQAPIRSWSRRLSKCSQVFIESSSIRWLLQYEINWLDDLKPIMVATNEVTTCFVH